MEKKQAWIKNVEFILLGENICIEDKPNKKIINLLETYFLLINAKRPFRKMSRFLSTNWPHTYDKLILRRTTIDGLCGSFGFIKKWRMVSNYNSIHKEVTLQNFVLVNQCCV